MMSKKRTITLTEGFLVDSFTNKISKIFYALVEISAYGEIEERYLIMNENETFQTSFLYKHSSDKIFNDESKAIEQSTINKKKEKEHYQEQVEYYQGILDELSKKE